MGYRYIGSKDKLSDIIISEIRATNKDAKHIIDLMAGTGLFSLALRENGFQVTAVDVMTYSYHHLIYHLLLSSTPDFKGINSIKKILKHQKNDTSDNTNYQAVLAYLNNLEHPILKANGIIK